MNSLPHILVVDDHRQIRDSVTRFLERNGMRATAAKDAREMDEKLAKGHFDLMVLDVMMPGEDGLSICKRLSAEKRLPIIMLTALGQDQDRIVGLEIGADDYVVKPFEPRELVARIRSVLRRASRSAPAVQADDEIFEFEGWRLDPLKRRLIDPEGVIVAISSVEFRLLMAFLEHPRQVLDRDTLLDMVQGREAHLFDRAVDNQVSRLRRKIEVDARNPELIQTVWGGGYRLACEVRRFVPEAG